MIRAPIRLKVYRWIVTAVSSLVLPRFFSRARIRDGKASRGRLRLLSDGQSSEISPLVWFHAASVGEMESLWPVLMKALGTGRNIAVTVFSESAQSQLRRLASAAEGAPGQVIFAGYAPFEGGWREYLERLKPKVFVTAKYEAWPELWAELSLRKIDLVIVGAKARRSLQICRSVVRAFGLKPPSLKLATADPEDNRALLELFPEAQVENLGEPRWDQVKARALAGNERARSLIALFRDLPRPWGVLGSAWPADLRFLASSLASYQGTLWIVPHRLDVQTIGEIEQVLVRNMMSFIKTSGLKDGRPIPLIGSSVRVVLVNEMGFLLELYGASDWAYVGGGFGDGIHSTIEPALYGVPVAGGPARAERFPETAILSRTGQLSLFGKEVDAVAWFSGLKELSNKREQWLQDAESRMGASDRVLRFLETDLS